MTEEKRSAPLGFFAALYVIGVYAFVPAFFLMNRGAAAAHSQAEYRAAASDWPLVIPLALGLINLLAVLLLRKRVTREQLLRCTVAVKYALIPFYLLGGTCIAAALLLMFTPVVIMVFVGPAVAVVFSVAGWLILLGAAPYSVGWLVYCGKERAHHPALLVTAGICQFLFTADVIAVMVLTLKERRFTKLTVTILIVLGILLLAALIAAAVLIAGIVRTAAG